MRSLRFLVVAGALLLGAAAGHAQTPRATITFDNKSGKPALVKIVGPTRQSVQVPDTQKRTVKASGGQYHIVTRYGAKPDDYVYSRGDAFQVKQTATQHSVITITLHKVVQGNYGTKPISAAEFEGASR